ncbi:hypothetical protein B0J18DRAFT_422696 [Chaetomium sp. MPI-SDFR-AT-0129]|nr:hypothetical protein B0J18DRAFT_422696 [Chaetomium sp. MPI-SDFR-AT-0129]
MAAIERNDVALTVLQWAHAVHNNKEIRDDVKKPGRLNELAVSDCTFSNSASDITHTEYLHLRTVWYRYGGTHIDSFARLLKDNNETGYRGFISPEADALATKIMASKSDSLNHYLREFHKTADLPEYLHPSPKCGSFFMVRYWQTMVSTHTKDGDTASSKIFKPQVGSDNARPVTPPQQNSTSGSPPKFETPAAKSHPAARGTSGNSPSADEAYVNTALLLLLQAATQDFQLHGHLKSLHWVPPRMALHLTVPTPNTKTGKFEDTKLLESRVDGYLCNRAADGGLSRPMAICEAKSAVRKSVQVPTERQEAAEMAAWICNRPGNEGLLQASASGRKRRLMISQTRDEVWIIVGEYGREYEAYIHNAPLKAGMPIQNAPPMLHVRTALPNGPNHLEESLGSPTFLDLVNSAKMSGDIEGWRGSVVQAALVARSQRKLAGSSSKDNQSGGGGGSAGSGQTSKPPSSQPHRSDSSSPDRGPPGSSKPRPGRGKHQPGGAVQSDAKSSVISGKLTMRPAPKPANPPQPNTGHPATGAQPTPPTQPPGLPRADGFLIMHRFGPWKTFDRINMEVFVRRLLGLMLELNMGKPPSRPSSSGSSK